MAAPPPRPHAAVALVAGVVLLGIGAPRAARGGVGAQARPSYTAGTTTIRDETGRETRTEFEQWQQRYRLSLDNQLYPLLTFGAGADLNWDIGSSRTDGVVVDSEARTWNTHARLTGGDRNLSGGIDFGRRWNEGETRQGGITSEAPGFVRQTVSAAAGWRPSDLPALSLRLSRADNHDDAREQVDVTSEEALLSASYQPVPDLSLRYAIRYSGATNHLTDVVRREILNSAAVTWGTRYLSDRGNLYAGYNVTARTADTRAPADAVVELQQLPIAGLSIVEAPPATPTDVALNPNPALVDGNVVASAGVNLGTAAGAGPLVAPRDLGAQFQDDVTPVTLVHVYVDQDQEIPPSLAALFEWEAYRSDDDDCRSDLRADGLCTWTPVPLSGPVVYNPVLFRFEVPIARTEARFLKLVTRPLPETASADPRFREIFVTELQFFDVVPAEEVRGRRSDVAGSLSGTTRVLLVRRLGLAYDFSGALSHAQERSPTWSIVNGLSLSRRLAPIYAVGARVERADADSGRGTQTQHRWSASLSAEPLPTLGAQLAYSGQLAEVEDGTTLSNSGTLSARADLYEGLAFTGTASASWSRAPTGVTSRALLGSVNGSVVPNRRVSLAGSFSIVDTTTSGGGDPGTHDRRGFAQGSVSVAPFPALSVAGTVSRQFGSAQESVTLWTFTGAFSPFPGGDLQLRYGYTETYDSAALVRTRAHAPSARWNIRPGWFVDAAYNIRETRGPVVRDESDFFNANLLITL